MNEFTAKKLGEVLAFSREGIKTFEMGHRAFGSVLTALRVETTIATLQKQAEVILSLVETDFKAITQTKADATSTKLRAMCDMYVGDEWDNPTELLEWLGFFEGAAIVHWDLVNGAARALKMSELCTLAEESRQFHHDLLHTVSGLLKTVGANRAQGENSPRKTEGQG